MCVSDRYKYTYMEEMLGNVAGCRQAFERWMEWEPDEQAWHSYINFELRYKEVDKARTIYEKYILLLLLLLISEKSSVYLPSGSEAGSVWSSQPGNGCRCSFTKTRDYRFDVVCVNSTGKKQRFRCFCHRATIICTRATNNHYFHH